MPFVSQEVAAAAAQSTVRQAVLAELRFSSQTVRLWNGFGVVDVGGFAWDGAGAFGAVEGLGQSRGADSGKVTLRMSGTDPAVIAIAKDEVREVQGRLAFIWQQLFDEDWQPIGPMTALYWGEMRRMTFASEPATDAEGPAKIVSIEIENAFAARARPPSRRYTDADHKALHPGDRFCQFVPTQREQTLTWPDT